MNLSGHHFEYAGQSSVPYGLFIGHIDTEMLQSSCGAVTYQTIFMKNSRRRHIGGIDWSGSPLSFEMEILSEQPIPPHTARQIQNWLFHAPTYQPLCVAEKEDDAAERVDGVVRRVHLDCVLYNPTAITFATGLHGWKCTCDCATPMALQESITREFDADDLSEPIHLYVDTDSHDYIYPQITVTLSDALPAGIRSQYAYGDINRDGKVNSSDARLAIQAATGIVTLDEEQTMLGDVTGDGYINSSDSSAILKYAAGILDHFEVEENGPPVYFPASAKYVSRYTYGDVNRDGRVDETDADLIAAFCRGEIPLDAEQQALARVTAYGSESSGGTVSDADVKDIVKYLNGEPKGWAGHSPSCFILPHQYLLGNRTDGTQMVLETAIPGSLLQIDCALGTILDGSGNSRYDQLIGRQFLRLLPGDNELIASEVVTHLTVTWTNERWLT